MSSLLIIAPIEKLQDEIISKVSDLNKSIGVYVSLNKTQRSTEELFRKRGIDSSKIFFIDCVTKEREREDVLHIDSDQLDMLAEAVGAFIKDIQGNKYLIIDALSTLLIYNSENKVAIFVQKIAEKASEKNVELIAFSPATQGEELLAKIFNFFDKVEKRR